MMEKSIVDFHQKFYIPAIYKLSLNLPHVKIILNNHCGNTLIEAFMCHSTYQYVFWHRYYAERVVASFTQQIQSEYYDGNIYVSIEGIALEHFSTTD